MSPIIINHLRVKTLDWNPGSMLARKLKKGNLNRNVLIKSKYN